MVTSWHSRSMSVNGNSSETAMLTELGWGGGVGVKFIITKKNQKWPEQTINCIRKCS